MVELNHTIVWVHEQEAAATEVGELLGIGPPGHFGPFTVLETGNGVSLDFLVADEVHPQHYAFLVTDDEFDEIFGRVQERGVDFWAEPDRSHPGEINRHDGGRGVYFAGPDGHLLEIITRPYGSGAAG